MNKITDLLCFIYVVYNIGVTSYGIALVTATFLRERGLLFAEQPTLVQVPTTELFGAFLAYWVEKLSAPGLVIDPLGLNNGQCRDPVVIYDPVLLGVNVASRITDATRRKLHLACIAVYERLDEFLQSRVEAGLTFKSLAEETRQIVGL